MSVIFEDNGQYTDAFNAFSEELAHDVTAMIEKFKCWLESQNASALDYRLAELVITDLFQLSLISLWLDKVSKDSLHRTDEGD